MHSGAACESGEEINSVPDAIVSGCSDVPVVAQRTLWHPQSRMRIGEQTPTKVQLELLFIR